MSGFIHEGRAAEGDLMLETDVVIVGSGSGGAVTAAHLAEAGFDVVVLEEGAHWAPEVYGRFRPSETLRELWRDSALTFTFPLGDSPAINVMMGRCIGGSSVLTGGVCFRTPEYVLHEWRTEHDLTELTPERMEACFKDVEAAVHVEEVPASMRSRSTVLYAEGAAKRGHPLRATRRNTKDCDGCSRCNFGCPHQAKMSVDLTYLPRAVKAGARIYSDCLVHKVVTKNGRAVGVQGRVLNGPRGRRGGKLSVRARRVILAAGAFHTPLLLMRSGVGRDSGQVGKNMTLHPSYRVMAVFDEPVHGWLGAMQSAYSDAFEHQGFTLMSLFTPPGVLAATMPGIGPEHAERAREIDRMAVFGGLIHDQGGGTVRPAIGREPFVTYRLSDRDHDTTYRMLRIIADDFFAAGARKVMLPVLGSEPLTADELRRLDLEHIPARQLECGSQHPLGTCRMGTGAGHSVVDPTGQTWEVEGLFVVDGSVLPTSLGVNPQISVMSMATHLAWGLRERRLPA